MKEDIEFPEVKGVSIAIVREGGEGTADWRAYLLNTNDYPIVNVIVASKGYGHLNGELQKTSVLRHLFEQVGAHDAVPIELVDQGVFHLVNEYWVSYYKTNPALRFSIRNFYSYLIQS